VRPKKNYLEVVIFLGRAVKAPQVRQVVESSKRKKANIVRLTHRDEVEAPVTDWLQEAYEVSETLSGSPRSSRSAAPGKRGTGRSSPRT